MRDDEFCCVCVFVLTDVKSSRALREVLYVILVAGNFLNAVSYFTSVSLYFRFAHIVCQNYCETEVI